MKDHYAAIYQAVLAALEAGESEESVTDAVDAAFERHEQA